MISLSASFWTIAVSAAGAAKATRVKKVVDTSNRVITHLTINNYMRDTDSRDAKSRTAMAINYCY